MPPPGWRSLLGGVVPAVGGPLMVAGGVLAVLLSLSLIYIQAYYHKYAALNTLNTPEPLYRALLAGGTARYRGGGSAPSSSTSRNTSTPA